MASSNPATQITDPDKARQWDLSGRLLRAVLWASALHWAAVAALVKIYTHIPLVIAFALGALGVAGNVVIERHLWRQNRLRLAGVVDPVTGELPGGRLPLPWRVRYGFPLWSVALTAIVIYLAAS